MKRKILTRILALSLSAVMLLANAVPISAAGTMEVSESKENIANGISNDVTWVIDSEGHLTISGNGDVDGIPWEEYRDEIKTAKIDVKGMTYARGLFEDCKNMTSVDLSDFDTSEITVMWDMFRGCSSLTSIDLSGFDTSNVYDMDALFEGCRSLTVLDLSNFDMAKVQYSTNMLYGCNNLEKIYTPKNSSGMIELPTPSRFYYWEDMDGTIYEYLSEGMSESIILERKYTGIKAEAPSLTVIEDGENTSIKVVNNDETYCDIRFGMVKEQEISDWVNVDSGICLDGFDSSLVSIQEFIGLGIEEGETCYIVAYASNEDKDRSEIVVLEDYPITINEKTMEEPITCQTGNVTGDKYFTEKNADEYGRAEATICFQSTDGEEWYETNEMFECNEGFRLYSDNWSDNIEKWTIQSVEFCKIIATEKGWVLEKEIYTSVVEGDSYEEPRAEAPSIYLEKVEGEEPRIVFQNNDAEDCHISYGLLAKEKIGESEELNHVIWIEASDREFRLISELIRTDSYKSGEYYVVAYAYNENKLRSELAVLEDYLITAAYHEMEESLKYQAGEFSGKYYFTEISTEEYDYAQTNVLVDNSWSTNSYLNTRDHTWCFDADNYNSWYEEWVLQETTFGRINFSDDGCTIENIVYTDTEESGIYEEIRTAAPGITLSKSSLGEVNGIRIKNNDDNYSDISYGLLSKEEIEEGNDVYTSWYIGNQSSVWISFEELVESREFEFGEYYVVAYAYNEYEFRSEMVVLEDYPIVISHIIEENPLIVQIGDLSENIFFPEIATDEYSYGEAEVLMYSSWIDSRALQKKVDKFYLSKNSLDGEYGTDYWLENVTFGSIQAEDTECVVKQISYVSFEDAGIFTEPKAEAPTLELHRNDEGKVVGVEITNNVSGDVAEICYGYLDTNISEWRYVEEGETYIVLFEDLYMPDMDNLTETAEFFCYSYDYNSNLYSENVILDYPITMDVQEYNGNEIVIYEEVYDDEFLYYIKADELSSDVRRLNVNGYEFYKSDNGIFWTITLWEKMGSIEELSIGRILLEEDGMTMLYEVVPSEKVVIESRESETKDVVLLDYDYYNAFIASGGSVTIDENGNVDISNDNFVSEDKWTLEYFYNSFKSLDVYSLVKNMADRVKSMANKYWVWNGVKFSDVNYYDMDGNIIGEDMIANHNVILIEYAPEIVWVVEG